MKKEHMYRVHYRHDMWHEKSGSMITSARKPFIATRKVYNTLKSRGYRHIIILRVEELLLDENS